MNNPNTRTDPTATLHTVATGERVQVAQVGKARFTRSSSGASRNYVAPTLNTTNPGMLHQSRALETPAADTARDSHETGRGCHRMGDVRRGVGNMVEMSGEAKALASPVTRSGSTGAGSERKLQNRVFVHDKHHKPLMPCTPARARRLLDAGRAVVHSYTPFTIRLKDRLGGDTQPIAVKIDPGATTTGLALVRIDPKKPSTQHILFLAEITHRGSTIRDNITQRKSLRRSRRGRTTRYRAPRFLNRTKPAGWIPPSLNHRVEGTLSWVNRFQRLAPVTSTTQEAVRFDMQKLENPDISGIEYQQGTLEGYEIKEYLLEKWGRCCVYCDKPNVPLQVEHIVPKSKGGSNRISNLTVACEPCNKEKDNMSIKEYLADEPGRLARILAETKKPLAAAAAVNATRRVLSEALRATGLPLELGTGGQTKWNRSKMGLPKTHALDAACVGTVDSLTGTGMVTLQIKAMGRGSHKRTRLTKDGFPRGYLSPKKQHYGFRTGDLVTALVPSGVNRGRHVGRVAVRATGNFNIQTAEGVVQGISHKHCTLRQRADGYAYAL